MTFNIYDVLIFFMSLMVFYHNYKVHKLEKMCIDTFDAMIEVQDLAINNAKQINKSIEQINEFINKVNKLNERS